MTDAQILVVRATVDEETLVHLARAWHGTLLKGVADIERGVLALGGEWHMDANIVLLADGSEQANVWGFNVYPAERGGRALEYTSLINIRPAQGNRDMELKDAALRKRVRALVGKFLPSLQI